jgi:putative endonuclease
MINTRARGREAEDQAIEFLRERGFKILRTNFALSGNFKGGEIDIIAEKGGRIHFIEVKSRESDKFGLGREAVTASKQRSIRRIATAFLVQAKLYDKVPCSFDVIEITSGVIEYLENCF